jgi:glycosyltransferase involved in cell wall biosynthesis
MTPHAGVSFVVPVMNGARTLDAALTAILGQDDGRPMEVIVVDDGSTDRSPAILERHARDPRVRGFRGEGRGAAAAINLGLGHASHGVVCQVDQDVLLEPGWMALLTQALQQPDVGAAQGRYVPDRSGGAFARVTALDLAQRYDRIRRRFVNHACTGNSAYRAEALRKAGPLDESIGYGYDNDLSYRLVAAGYRLVFCRDATSVHHMRDSFAGYLRQQYGLGYGRLDVVAKHPSHVGGDDVSGPAMMLHAPLGLAALLGAIATLLVALAGGPWRSVLPLPVAALAVASAERVVTGLAATWRYSDPAGLLFAPVHLARDIAWAMAILVWSFRRLGGRRSRPEHSMPRDRRPEAGAQEPPPARADFIALIPAYNEAASLPVVVDELRRSVPSSVIVVVDDASSDETPAILDRLGVRRLRLRQRLGVGGAVRAGLRYAWRLGHDIVVRVDGDGQHAASDIPQLLEPIRAGRADVTRGTRYRTGGNEDPPRLRRASLGILARCLSFVTKQQVTDPTSGFWAFGPRAVRFLAAHHPSGYPEPELHLLLSRNGLRVEEVPIRMRDRLGGRTSLTRLRTGHLLARTLLALVVVPLRSTAEVPRHD